MAAMLPVFLAGCTRLKPQFNRACAAASRVPRGDEAAMRAFLQTYFEAQYLGTDMVSGYYELSLRGSRVPAPGFSVPVLRPPANPQRWSKSEIEAGRLEGQGLEILYLRSRADLFFLHLQGSGRVRLTDGSEVRLGTIASNNRRQVSTEQLFGDAPIPGRDLSIPGIRAWLDANPAGEARLERDQSYVFFRETPELSPYFGPLGRFGLPLVPLRSAAVDDRVVPLGSLIWLETRASADQQPLPHLGVAHDTGDQIRGKARVDLYFGWGTEAEQVGGRQWERGQVWVLVPR
jgi:membrane-bound lytic murein transglycosylase A